MTPLLEVENLSIHYPSRRGLITAVRDVSFTLGRERLGIVGESGSGKSQTSRAIMGLTPPQARIEATKLRFDGIDLLQAAASDRRKLRGARMAMVMQDPKYSLNPVARIGQQIVEALHAQRRISRAEARRRALGMLEAVSIRDPQRVFDLYPHEVSGGMGQRAMIAMMLVNQPELLIADEPTSALDVTVQLDVLRVIDDLVTQRGMGLVLISHDLRLVASFCDRVLVMYAGQVVETLDSARLDQARHPYTLGLLDCVPQLDRPRHPLPTLERRAEWLQ
ncbi:ABC transporter ATP-binding protein [Halotalea alkalilenta]|uniref:ABC-type dipeptide transporter n=1 Tax=Halotalea alkalilenta TaxID=376489 RepID=A0A172YFF7_9GAMM|nr:ABC transporter ATP-binding protein [Halotalea alkalilenta]ANF57963.1 peptide ABC transporter ATP-binding protein [Halotalea alkalilenta]